MKKLLIKTLCFVVITLAFLFDYRILHVKEDKVLIANFDKRSSWSEVYDILSDVRAAEIYEKPYNNKSNEYDYYVVFYTNSNLYNIKASELDLERVESMLRVEQVSVVEVEPVDLWFYGLMYVMVIVFPIMRKVQ